MFQTSESCIKLHAVDVLELLLSEQCPLLQVCVCVCPLLQVCVCVCVHCSRCVCVCVHCSRCVCVHCSRCVCVCVCPLLQVCVCVCVCVHCSKCVCVCVCVHCSKCVYLDGSNTENTLKCLNIGKPIYRSISSLGSLSCWKTQPPPIFNALTERRRLLP